EAASACVQTRASPHLSHAWLPSYSLSVYIAIDTIVISRSPRRELRICPPPLLRQRLHENAPHIAGRRPHLRLSSSHQLIPHLSRHHRRRQIVGRRLPDP